MKFVCIYLDNCYAQQSLSFEAESLERAVVGLPARCRGRIGFVRACVFESGARRGNVLVG